MAPNSIPHAKDTPYTNPQEQKELMRSFLEDRNTKRRTAYRECTGDLKEHHGIEQTVLAGGYGWRQIMELVQNGADAILEAHESGVHSEETNRIHVFLHESRLYVANTGAPLSEEGLVALLSSHSSPKRGNQIGRFGLGFKSLLRLGGPIDLFTRKSGIIRFDPQRCRDELRQEFNVTEAPGLRLAWPLDESERNADENLGQFAWAETIVRVEVKIPGILQHLREEISTFPAEFLLFFPVSTTLLLDDGEKPLRELRLDLGGIDQLLHDGNESSRWRLAKREVTISDESALADATHIHARKSVPLTWAVPLEGKREEAGRFWAFFPTNTPTYLPGILNAPWKLNSDRKAIIGGEWNSALMIMAASLIAETLPSLSTTEDPARPLDAFPRQMERKDEEAAPLVEALWGAIQNTAVVPDATGVLRQARGLWRHPRENANLARQWQALAGCEGLSQITHPSCLERQRGSRLNALALQLTPQGKEKPSCSNLQKREETSWFEAVASTNILTAIQVLKLAEIYEKDCRPGEWNSVRSLLAIIPSDTGELMTSGQLVFAPPSVSIPGRAAVALAICADTEANRIIRDVMKVKALDDTVWESILIEALPYCSYSWESPSDDLWRSFWEKLQAAPVTVRNKFIAQYSHQIRVRRRDGEWVLSDEVIFPGELVDPDDSSTNQNVLVDNEIHGRNDAELMAIGVCECPKGNIECRSTNDLVEWLNACRKTYKNSHKNSASWEYLKPFCLTMPKGWVLLSRLTGSPNARLTERLLERITQGEFGKPLKFGHSTVTNYPTIEVPHPLPWYILKYGMLHVGDETVRLVAVVARRREPSLAKLPIWQQIQAVLDKLEGTTPIIPATQIEIRDLWLALIRALAIPQAHEDDSLRELWAGAALDGIIPEFVLTEAGKIPLAQVFVTGSPDLARRARTANRIVVTLNEHALNLWIKSGAHNLTELMKPEWTEQTGPVDLLISTIPELAEVLQDEAKVTARCQSVVGLQMVIAGETSPLPCLMWENTLLLDAVQLASLSRADRLQCLLAEVAAAGWLRYEPGEALRSLGDAQVDALRMNVMKGSTLAERLLLAVGNRNEPLLHEFGNISNREFIRQCTPIQLAELVLAQLGPATLTVLKDTLAEEGLKPPLRWNTSEARAFVVSIGFPDVFAVSPETRREAEEFISGPIELPPLHDFQEEVLEGIRALVTSNTTRRRAVVSLPTGGGKTRVTVEAAVLLALKPEGGRRSVLWVAQTDELCEQAVQAFRQVWINLGVQRTDLRIVRLWGGNPTPVFHDVSKPLVVVASIQTINSRMGTDRLARLQSQGLVVVDECHHAITPSYTNLLRWLDAEAPRPGAPEKNEPPIVGLSATPFRTDDEESQRLAKRFDNRWFPSDQEELHARLYSQGVLAKANYEALQSGVGLLEEEIERLAGLPEPWEGLDFENILEAINQRLAGDAQRNQRLVERIQECTERSILFFANSVEHAVEMSARLNLAGISASAVCGTTPTVARRYFLDCFQRGDIHVLCNHTVLSMGFDAPKTDMVLIARQVFSPVRYMQMVGRGLRGEKNGGTACCRIVTVVDNLGRFQDRHPYHYCQRYFTDWSEEHRTGQQS